MGVGRGVRRAMLVSDMTSERAQFVIEVGYGEVAV